MSLIMKTERKVPLIKAKDKSNQIDDDQLSIYKDHSYVPEEDTKDKSRFRRYPGAEIMIVSVNIYRMAAMRQH